MTSMSAKTNTKDGWLPLAFILALALLAYAGKALQFGFFSDDWYLVFSGLTYGPEKYWDVFIVDRPLRAVLQFVLFSLFDTNVTLYYLTALVVRVAGALGMYWMLRLVLKEHKPFGVMAAALFLVYPGFLELPDAMDFMAQQVSMTAMVFSICFSILFVISARRLLARLGYLALSAGLALVSYLLLEYHVGMEAYRFLFLSYILWQRKTLLSKNTVLVLSPLLIAPVAFTVWRLFFFSGARANTSLSFVQSGLSGGVFDTLMRLGNTLLIDIAETFVGAFVQPFSALFGRLGAADAFVAVLLGLAAAAATLALLRRLPGTAATANFAASRDGWLLVGLAFAAGVFCLLVINLASRNVEFLFYNRFSFPSALAVAIVLAFIGFSFKNRSVQIAFFSVVIFFSVATHFANNVRFAQEWTDTRRFWQQVVWRIPNVQDWTVLTGDRVAPIYEDYYLWSPLNLLYRPYQGQIALSAEVLNAETAQSIRANIPAEKNRRSLYLMYDFERTLLFTQPTREACVRFINAEQIELSVHDDPLVVSTAPYSSLGQVELEGSADKVLFARLFGEPSAETDWCYFYQKADLARQRGDWEQVAAYGDEAAAAGLAPADAIEWMPFVQAYAYRGEMARAAELAEIIGATPYYRWQACGIFSAKAVTGAAAIDAGNAQLAALFCTDGE